MNVFKDISSGSKISGEFDLTANDIITNTVLGSVVYSCETTPKVAIRRVAFFKFHIGVHEIYIVYNNQDEARSFSKKLSKLGAEVKKNQPFFSTGAAIEQRKTSIGEEALNVFLVVIRDIVSFPSFPDALRDKTFYLKAEGGILKAVLTHYANHTVHPYISQYRTAMESLRLASQDLGFRLVHHKAIDKEVETIMTMKESLPQQPTKPFRKILTH